MCLNFLFYYPRITGQAFSFCDTTLFEPSLRLLHKYLWVLRITILVIKHFLSCLPCLSPSQAMTHTFPKFRVKLACTFNFTDAIIHIFGDSNPGRKEQLFYNVSNEPPVRRTLERFGQNWIIEVKFEITRHACKVQNLWFLPLYIVLR